VGGSAVKVPVSNIFGYFGSIGFAIDLPLIQLYLSVVEGPSGFSKSIYQTWFAVFPLIILFELHVPLL
jgi:hypothetical protein